MNYNTHKLSSQNHSHIIGRQDSVTGDTIQANNEVVFCSACQSVFLKESWEYMDSKHCNQAETLGFVPAQQQRIEAKKNIFFLEIPITKLGFYLGVSFLLLVMTPGVLILTFTILMIQIMAVKVLLGAILLGCIISTVIDIRKKKERLIKQTGAIKVYGKEIFLTKKICEDKSIKKIVYNCNNRYLRIYYNDINYNDFDLNSKTKFPNNLEFLNSLMSFSEYTQVSFYSKNTKEFQFLDNKKQEYKSEITVTNSNPFEENNELQ